MLFIPGKRYQREKCTGCGVCSDVCPSDSIKTDDRGIVISFATVCIGCAHCGCYCPSNCFDLPGKPQGEVSEEHGIQNLFESRRSTRKFSDKIPGENVIKSLLAPVGFAPTGRNAQGITVDVILGRERIYNLIVKPLVRLVRILDCFRFLSLLAGSARGSIRKIRQGKDIITWNAPCVLLFRAPVGNVTGKTDAVIAATMVSIKAETIGLGSLWNGVVQLAWPVLRISKYHAVLCIGYPSLKKHQHVPERDWIRRDISRNK